jgi:hypothetical protein
MTLSIKIASANFSKFIGYLKGIPVSLQPADSRITKAGSYEAGFSYNFVAPRQDQTVGNNSEVFLPSGVDGALRQTKVGVADSTQVMSMKSTNTTVEYNSTGGFGMFVKTDTQVIRVVQGTTGGISTNVATATYSSGMVFQLRREGENWYAEVSNDGVDFTVLHNFSQVSSTDMYPQLAIETSTESSFSVEDLELRGGVKII